MPLQMSHLQTLVYKDRSAGPHAERRYATCLADASRAVAEVEQGLLHNNVKVYVRQTALRSAAWPKDEKCDCYLMCVCE